LEDTADDYGASEPLAWAEVSVTVTDEAPHAVSIGWKYLPPAIAVLAMSAALFVVSFGSGPGSGQRTRTGSTSPLLGSRGDGEPNADEGSAIDAALLSALRTDPDDTRLAP
jgi:hypothetical protein